MARFLVLLNCVAALSLATFVSNPPAMAQDDLSAVVEECMKSVVRIDVEGKQNGLGSGFIVEADGLLVTNVHVLEGASKAVAYFKNGTTAVVEGTYVIDVYRDICVARIRGENLPVLKLAAALPRQIERVFALGQPRGLNFSATDGTVSGIRSQDEIRQQLGDPKREGTWIQTNADLSGGNSGGPLINVRGEVVAMNTLASQGGAQNLNFAISVDDIRQAISKAKNAELVELKLGVGKVDLEEVAPVSAVLIERGPIPETAIDNYIEKTRQDYDSLSSDIRKASTAAKKKLAMMRKGEDYIPNGNDRYDMAILPGRSTDTYYFRNESVKKRRVSDQDQLVSRLQNTREKLAREPDNESLFALMTTRGPRLDPRQVNEIGFMADGTVVHAFNEKDIIVLYDDAYYLMWVKSTAGLSPGQDVAPGPVYVAGTRTVEVPDQGTRSLTILNSVMESELREVLFSGSEAPQEFRVWTGSNGITIEAMLIECTDERVKLKLKKDGREVEIPMSRLSAEDQKLLQDRK